MAIGVWYNVNGVVVGGSWASIYDGGFEWQIVSQDIANNTSVLKVRQWIRKSSTSYNFFNLYDRTSYYSIAGVQYNFTSRVDMRTTTGIAANTKYYMEDDGIALAFPKCITKTVTITHNADGTKTVPITTFFSANDDSDHVETITTSATVTLDTIPRASVAGSGVILNINTAATTLMGFTIVRASTSFEHTVNLYYETTPGVWTSCATQAGVQTTGTFTFNDTIIKAMCDSHPTTTQFALKMTIITFSGGTQIGTSDSYGYANITFAQPTLSTSTYIDSNTDAIYGASANQTLQTIIGVTSPVTLLQKTSKLRITTGTTTKQALRAATTTIVSYRARVGSNTVTVVSGASSGVVIDVPASYLDFTTNTTIYVDVVDSRGNVGTDLLTIKVLPYSAPNVSVFAPYRNNNYDAQSYVNVTYDVQSIINTSQRNVGTVRVRTKNNTTGVWTGYTTITNPTPTTGNRLTYTISAQTLGLLDQSTSHAVEITTKDYINTTYVATNATINKGTPIVRFQENSVDFGVIANMPSGSGITGSGTGTANTAVIEFNESDGTTRVGYIGKGSGASNTLHFVNNIDGGHVNIATTGAGEVQANGNKIWHAGNDGNGSGLDADLLHGFTTIEAGQTDSWGKVPVIGGTDGVMEVGKYLDFHEADGSAVDFNGRLESSGGLPFWSSLALERVVASGSSGTNWWLKYANGIVIKWGYFSASVTVQTAVGGVYVSAIEHTLTFNTTIPFTGSPPAVFLNQWNANGSGYWAVPTAPSASLTTFRYQWYRPASTGATTLNISYFAIGRG